MRLTRIIVIGIIRVTDDCNISNFELIFKKIIFLMQIHRKSFFFPKIKEF